MTTQKRLFFVFLLVGSLSVGTASATPLIFTGSSGNLSASASFVQNGNNLVVTLTNTSLFDVLVPSDVLSAVFFGYSGSPLSLAPVSAVLPAGSVVVNGPTDPGGVVGGEWAYRGGLGPSAPAAYGISSAGLGIFGAYDLFPGSNLQGPASPAGVQYGITSPFDNPLTANGGLAQQSLIASSVQLSLTGLPDNFQSTHIGGVVFQYGASLNGPQVTGNSVPGVPEPGTLGMLALGFTGLAAVWARRRKTCDR